MVPIYLGLCKWYGLSANQGNGQGQSICSLRVCGKWRGKILNWTLVVNSSTIWKPRNQLIVEKGNLTWGKLLGDFGGHDMDDTRK